MKNVERRTSGIDLSCRIHLAREFSQLSFLTQHARLIDVIIAKRERKEREREKKKSSGFFRKEEMPQRERRYTRVIKAALTKCRCAFTILRRIMTRQRGRRDYGRQLIMRLSRPLLQHYRHVINLHSVCLIFVKLHGSWCVARGGLANLIFKSYMYVLILYLNLQVH